MKVFVQDGIVTAQAESEAEINKLFSLREYRPVGRPSGVKELTPRAKHKKHMFKKPCDICGKMYKKVNMHKTYSHGMAPVTPAKYLEKKIEKRREEEQRRLQVNSL